MPGRDKDMKLISWNVNGLRAAQRKGFLEYLRKNAPDMLCLQETKAHAEQLDEEILHIPGYTAYFAQGERKGYSGVALYTRQEPGEVERDFGGTFGEEGRILIAHYEAVTLYTIYFPNGAGSPERLRYKLDFYDACLNSMEEYRAMGREIILCGDLNTAHEEIDIARPRENAARSGFLREERDWLDALADCGYIDTFRTLYPSAVAYTWWDTITRAKQRDVGWRLDYFYVTPGLWDQVLDAGMQREEDASDHCPIYLSLARERL